jgi:hypothetical protein
VPEEREVALWIIGEAKYPTRRMLPTAIVQDFCPPVSDFTQSRIGSEILNVSELARSQSVVFRLEIQPSLPVSALLQCLREILRVGTSDSLILFAGQANTQRMFVAESDRIGSQLSTPFVSSHMPPNVAQGVIGGIAFADDELIHTVGYF